MGNYLKFKKKNNNNLLANPLNVKIIQSIPSYHARCIRSLCFLRDRRLVSGSEDNSIIIYTLNTYEIDIHIRNAHDSYVFSVCGLGNGNLASGSEDCKIKIWEIIGNEYRLIHSLCGHINTVNKIIESEEGKLWSCSWDSKIKVWDNNNNYQCIQTLEGHIKCILSLLEVNNSIISSGDYEDKSIRIWNKATYQCDSVIINFYSNSRNSIAKLKDNLIILGGECVIHIINTLFCTVYTFSHEELRDVNCFSILEDGRVLIGCGAGMMFCFDPISSQIIFKKEMHRSIITCLIKSEDTLISSSIDKTINIYSL